MRVRAPPETRASLTWVSFADERARDAFSLIKSQLYTRQVVNTSATGPMSHAVFLLPECLVTNNVLFTQLC